MMTPCVLLINWGGARSYSTWRLGIGLIHTSGTITLVGPRRRLRCKLAEVAVDDAGRMFFGYRYVFSANDVNGRERRFTAVPGTVLARRVLGADITSSPDSSWG